MKRSASAYAAQQMGFGSAPNTEVARENHVRTLRQARSFQLQHAIDNAVAPLPHVQRRLDSIEAIRRQTSQRVVHAVGSTSRGGGAVSVDIPQGPPVAVVQVDAVYMLELRARRKTVAVGVLASVLGIPTLIALLFNWKDMDETLRVVLLVLLLLSVLGAGGFAAYVYMIELPAKLSVYSPKSRKQERVLKKHSSGRGLSRVESARVLDDPNDRVDKEALCLICKKQLKQSCGRFKHSGAESKCPPAVGKCGHVFHFHCVAHHVDSCQRFEKDEICPHRECRSLVAMLPLALTDCASPYPLPTAADAFIWEWSRKADKDHFTEFKSPKKRKGSAVEGGGGGGGGSARVAPAAKAKGPSMRHMRAAGGGLPRTGSKRVRRVTSDRGHRSSSLRDLHRAGPRREAFGSAQH